MSKANEKLMREAGLDDAVQCVPEKFQGTYKTMLRQGGWLRFGQISAGNYSHIGTGAAVIGLCRLGKAEEGIGVFEDGRECRIWRAL